MQYISKCLTVFVCTTLLAQFGCGDNTEPNADPFILLADMEMVTPDASDGAVIDAMVPVAAEMPLAQLYLNDPVSDEGVLSEVTMHRPISQDGRLTSEWVEVFNCLNEEGGDTAMPNFGPITITVNLCHEVQVARPDSDGHYLSITPPEDDSDPNDSFSEIMMYHHVNIAHDFFKDTLGFESLDFSLPALVNVQVKTDPPLPFLMPGPDGWVGLANAAFFPRESWQQFASQFGLPPRDSDSIIFFQGDKDFAYDSRVVYHEYTHAVVGTSRLQVPAVLDQYGLDNSAPSMNEGIADYFAASISGDPRIGRYVGVMGLGLRDLSSFRSCPEDIADEVHAQGELIGSMLWSLRDALGQETADAIAYRALERFGLATTHNQAAELILEEAQRVDSQTGNQALEILNRHGMLDCVRSMPFTNFNVSSSRARVPHLVEGKSTSGLPGLNMVVPAYKQFYIEHEPDAQAVRLSWNMSAGGGGLTGGGGQISALQVAYNRPDPVFLDISGRQLGIESEFMFTPALVESRQSIVLGRSCFPELDEQGHLLLLNPGNDQVQITSMSIQYLADEPDGIDIERCGDLPIDASDMGTDPVLDMGASDDDLDAGVEMPIESDEGIRTDASTETDAMRP